MNFSVPCLCFSYKCVDYSTKSPPPRYGHFTAFLFYFVSRVILYNAVLCLVSSVRKGRSFGTKFTLRLWQNTKLRWQLLAKWSDRSNGDAHNFPGNFSILLHISEPLLNSTQLFPFYRSVVYMCVRRVYLFARPLFGLLLTVCYVCM